MGCHRGRALGAALSIVWVLSSINRAGIIFITYFFVRSRLSTFYSLLFWLRLHIRRRLGLARLWSGSLLLLLVGCGSGLHLLLGLRGEVFFLLSMGEENKYHFLAVRYCRFHRCVFGRGLRAGLSAWRMFGGWLLYMGRGRFECSRAEQISCRVGLRWDGIGKILSKLD